jgi:hypothetical protein
VSGTSLAGAQENGPHDEPIAKQSRRLLGYAPHPSPAALGLPSRNKVAYPLQRTNEKPGYAKKIT